MRKIRWKWVFGGFSLTLAVAVVIYYIFSTKEIIMDFPIKTVSIAANVLLFLIFLAIGIGPWFLDLFSKVKKEDYSSDRPKDPVGTALAVKIWTQEFIKDNKVPSKSSDEDILGEKRLIPIRPRSLEFSNYSPVPVGREIFYKFQIQCQEGNFVGSMIVIIPIERGKKHIKENWNFFIKHDSMESNFKYNPRNNPLTNIQAQHSDALQKRTELLEDGYDLREANELLGITNNPLREDVSDKPKKNKYVRTTAEDMFPEHDFSSDDSDDSDMSAEDIRQSIEAQRKRSVN